MSTTRIHHSGAPEPRIIVALDFAEEASALDLAGKLDPQLCALKIGKEMFTRFGPGLVRRLVGDGYKVFLDLKFHDIPNTVAKACQAAADLGVWMVNVHASGGTAMMSAAREALESGGRERPLLIGVTVLTSMDEAQYRELGLVRELPQQVLHLASMAQQSGLDGVVCSAREAATLKAQCGKDFLLVTPGIRPAGSAAGDQSRIMTPEQAIRAGSDYLVIGRPITQAGDSLKVAYDITESIVSVLASDR